MKQILVMFGIVLVLIAFAFATVCLQPSHRMNPAKSKLAGLASKIELHALDTRRLARTLEELLVSSDPDWSGPYARPEDLLDPWGRTIQYSPGTDGREYVLLSLGSDGLPGGEGHAADIRNED